MRVRFIILACSLSMGAVSVVPQRNPVCDDIAKYVYPRNIPASPASFSYMPDGKSYLMLSDDKKTIDRYDTGTGDKIETVVDVATTRENRIPDISGFTISPDGSKILVFRDKEMIYRRSFTAEYYVYEVRSRLLKPLSSEFSRQQAPVISPDGRMVAFVVDNNIYIKKLDYDTQVAVTADGKRNEIINGVPDWTYEEEFSTTSSMVWAPDNLTLCYLKYDESQVPMFSFPVYQGTCEPKDEYALYPGIYSYKYPVAGQPNSKVSVHSYDVDTRKTKDISLPDDKIEYIPRIAYAGSPDRLAVSTLNRDQNHFEIYAVNPKSTVVKSMYTDDSKTWISPSAYENLRYYDDNFVVFSSRSGYNHVYQYSYTGTMMRAISSGDYDVTAYYGCDSQGNHYYQSTAVSPLTRVVSKVDRKGAVTHISRDNGTTSASFSPDMSYAMLCYSDVNTPPVYTLHTSSGKLLRTIEDNSDYRSRYAGDIPAKEFFSMQSGPVTLNGYMIKPMDFDPSRKYPVIMSQYSGPESQSVLDRWSMDWDYFYAKKGYIVMCVDGRGTGGRGREFMDVVYKRLGYYETIDQINAARYAGSLPYVDSSRIGIFGWSYGGYEALMAASATGSPYAAAVAVAPVTDWRYYDTVYAERYMLTPQQNEDGYDASSPMGKATSLGCRLLLMSGTADDNVHDVNMLQYVSVLQSHGILCDMFMFPNMNHSILGCDARALVYAKMLDFFDRNLK